MKTSNFSRIQTKMVKKSGRHIVRPTQMSQAEIRAHISENLRQSFCAEGVCYSKAEWNQVSQRLSRKK